MMALNESAESPTLLSSFPTESSSLNDLSNDILLNIVHFVGIAQNSSITSLSHVDLLSLALCSRRLHELAEPELYTKLNQTSSWAILGFTCRILERPDLALRTKVFSMKAERSFLLRESEMDDESSVWSWNRDGLGMRDQDLVRIRTSIQRASASEKESRSWIRHIKSGSWDATAALILSITPNLEHLELGYWAYKKKELPFIFGILEPPLEIQSRSIQPPLIMARLKTLRLTDYGELSFETIIPFLKHGPVSTLIADRVCETGDGIRVVRALFVPTMKKLALSRSCISHGAILALFRCFPYLRSLYYEDGGFIVGNAEFQPPLMMSALEHLKAHLEELTIILEETYSLEEPLYMYPIGSLVDFQRLAFIDVSISILVGEDSEEDNDPAIRFPRRQRLVDSVPPTLQHLCLRNCKEYAVPQIFEFISQKALRTPKFHTINLEWKGVRYVDNTKSPGPIFHPGFKEEETGELMAACSAVGVGVLMKYIKARRIGTRASLK